MLENVRRVNSWSFFKCFSNASPRMYLDNIFPFNSKLRTFGNFFSNLKLIRMKHTKSITNHSFSFLIFSWLKLRKICLWIQFSKQTLSFLGTRKFLDQSKKFEDRIEPIRLFCVPSSSIQPKQSSKQACETNITKRNRANVVHFHVFM